MPDLATIMLCAAASLGLPAVDLPESVELWPKAAIEAHVKAKAPWTSYSNVYGFTQWQPDLTLLVVVYRLEPWILAHEFAHVLQIRNRVPISETWAKKAAEDCYDLE